MTREEEIREAINKVFPCTNGGRCYEQSIGATGFEFGVNWADKNPDLSSLWHNASEVPQKQRNLLLIDKQGLAWVCDFYDRLDNPDGWEKYVKKKNH